MSIPLDANFKSVSCQLGGLRLNGIYNSVTPNSGTAQSLSVVTIDDPAVVQSPTISTVKGYLQVNVGVNPYYIPLY